MSEQKIINDFFRKYVDSGFKTTKNSIKLNPGHTEAHKRRIFDVCNTLLNHGIPFWTEVRLKCSCIPDVIAPTHVTPFIEILSTETEEMFRTLKLPKYPVEIRENFGVKLVFANEPYSEKVLF